MVIGASKIHPSNILATVCKDVYFSKLKTICSLFYIVIFLVVCRN
jgi:hypothetical protein